MAGSAWSYRSDAWWAHVASVLAVVVGVVGALGASRPGAPIQVAAATVLAVAGFKAKARWSRLPSLALLFWAGAPAVVVNLRVWSEGLFFLLVVAVSYVALTEPDRRIRLAVGVAGVSAPPLVAALTPHHQFGWPFWMMGIFFGWLSGEQMRRFRRLVAELEATRERLAAQAVSLERRRIAAELHDLVGHSLTVVLLYLTGARRQLEDDPVAAAQGLRDAEAIGRAGLAEIRRNVAALRDSSDAAMTPIPGAGDVPDLVDRLAAAGSKFDLRATGDLASVEAIVGVVVYRVVQESLSNAARHAPGRRSASCWRSAPMPSTCRWPTTAQRGAPTEVPAWGSQHAGAGRGGGWVASRRPGRGWEVRARVPRPPPAGVDRVGLVDRQPGSPRP